MSCNLGTAESPILVFVTDRGSSIDATLRCESVADFIAAAIYAELIYIDEAGDQRTAVGVDIDHIGRILLTGAKTNSEGDEVAPAVFDPRHHVNIRLSGAAITSLDEFGILKWHKWAMAWMFSGVADAVPNRAERSVDLYGVSLIDLPSINSPSRVWFGNQAVIA